MKVNIGKFEIECSPDEMAELLKRCSNAALEAEPTMIATVPVAEKPHKRYIPTPHRIVRGMPVKILTSMLRQNPELMNLSDVEIAKKYAKFTRQKSNYPNTTYIYRNIAKAKILAKASQKKPTKVGKKPFARERMVTLLKEQPNLINESMSKRSKAYRKRYGLSISNSGYSKTFKTNMESAVLQVMKELGKKAVQHAPQETPAHVPKAENKYRIFTFGASYPFCISILDKMPKTFNSSQFLMACMEKLNIPVTDVVKMHNLKRQVWINLKKMVKNGYLIAEKHIMPKKNFRFWVYTKQDVSSSPKHKEPIDNVLGIKPISTEGGYVQQIEPEEYNPPIISRESLDMLINNHLSFGYETLIGLRAKNGMIIKDNDARYLFKNLMENISGLSHLYPHKKFRISGQGQFKVIEIN